MQQNFSVPINPAIELIIRLDSTLQPNLMADHETRLGPTRDDQIAEIAVVRLDIALAGAEGEALLCVSMDLRSVA